MVKAAAGGGGRGMRVVRKAEEFQKAFTEAKNEARNAFGDDTIFLEKFIEDPKHIEVQLLGDQHGNIVHLYERDCSVQRRFQKVVEIAPSFGLKQETKNKLYAYALQLGRAVNYSNAGTVEFLVDKNENIYFIEVNPRIQVEHTITEEVTGIDIVRTQILIAMGYQLSDNGIYINHQDEIPLNGYAIQCRITTEDPANGFKPDFGTITAYRNAAGFGIRLDEGSSYAGMKISPYFDSMIVKVSARGRTLKGATQRLTRALVEFRIRGVKTNIGFLLNVISNPVFQRGEARVSFIETHPELFDFRKPQDRSTRVLNYLAEVIVNGNPEVKKKDDSKVFRTPVVPPFNMYGDYPAGNRDRLKDAGPRKICAVGKRPEMRSLYRHDLPRWAPVAAGYPRPDAGSAESSRRICEKPPGTLLDGSLGWRYLRCSHAVPVRKSLETAGSPARSHAQHAAANAVPWLKRGWLLRLSR